MEVNKLYNESNMDTMKRIPSDFIDSIITDPPYELGFMGKSWDNTGISYSIELWKECLRVLKPGGHLLAFGGSRTYHRMACAIEDAGFEIRDMVEWIYGSGFPKSLNISKQLDKQAGVEMDVIGEKIRGDVQVAKEKGVGFLADPANRNNEKQFGYGVEKITIPTTDSAKQWQGWGTALKPAHEPICLARKPLGEKTVAENVLKYGTGGINIDGCRVGYESQEDKKSARPGGKITVNIGCFVSRIGDGEIVERDNETFNPPARFPANLIHDGSSDVVEIFPKTAGAAAPVKSGMNGDSKGIYGDFAQKGDDGESFYNDKGSAARFFYCAKTSPAERNMGCDELEEKQQDESRKDGNPSGDNPRNRGVNKRSNNHPTVKPLALMRYLCRLITPPQGLVYDPFTGSGSTLIACKQEGFNYIGSELQPEYCEIAEARIKSATKEIIQPTLF